jgi:hypothetical protein
LLSNLNNHYPQKLNESGVDFAAFMTFLHDNIRSKMAEQTTKYAAHANLHKRDMQFKKGDLVLIRLHPERFLLGTYDKLHARMGGPFKALKRIGTNAYLIDLQPKFQFNLVFNVTDLTSYHGPLPLVESTAPANVLHIQPITEVADSILTHQFVSMHREGYHKFSVK